MKIRFFNARILPLDDKTPLFTGELVVDGSTILAMQSDCSQFSPFDREIDCGGNLLLPGFKTPTRTVE